MLEDLKELLRFVNHIILWINSEIGSHVTMSSLNLLVIAIVYLELLPFLTKDLLKRLHKLIKWLA